jgi:hypothetical protein
MPCCPHLFRNEINHFTPRRSNLHLGSRSSKAPPAGGIQSRTPLSDHQVCLFYLLPHSLLSSHLKASGIPSLDRSTITLWRSVPTRASTSIPISKLRILFSRIMLGSSGMCASTRNTSGIMLADKHLWRRGSSSVLILRKTWLDVS